MMKIKSLQNGISDIDTGKGEAIIQFATYGTPDRDKDVANQGMFTKTWREFKDVRLFYNHDKTQAPGKILKLWDDKQGAYSQAKFGTHTLGQDTIKQMADGIITDASYLMYPTKWTSKAAGGMNITECFHKEVSVLTHWGSHPESKILSVQKNWASEATLSESVLKQLNSDEVVFLRNNVAGMNTNLMQLVSFAANLNESSDLYTWLNDMISSLSYSIQRFKNQLVWGQKEWSIEELGQRVTKLKSFARNSTASDECLQGVIKEAEAIEELLLINSSTVAATEKALQQHDEVTQLTPDQLKKIKLLNALLS